MNKNIIKIIIVVAIIVGVIGVIFVSTSNHNTPVTEVDLTKNAEENVTEDLLDEFDETIPQFVESVTVGSSPIESEQVNKFGMYLKNEFANVPQGEYYNIMANSAEKINAKPKDGEEITSLYAEALCVSDFQNLFGLQDWFNYYLEEYNDNEGYIGSIVNCMINPDAELETESDGETAYKAFKLAIYEFANTDPMSEDMWMHDDPFKFMYERGCLGERTGFDNHYFSQLCKNMSKFLKVDFSDYHVLSVVNFNEGNYNGDKVAYIAYVLDNSGNTWIAAFNQNNKMIDFTC